MRLSIFSLSLLLLAARRAVSSQEVPVTETCPVCTFDVEKEPRDCKAYGMAVARDDMLAPWHHAIRPCLQGLGIPNLTMSQQELYDFCPNTTINNETELVEEVNFDTFVNLVRDEPEKELAMEIMTLFEDRLYFILGPNGTVALNETYMNPQGVLHNCTATPSFCWNDIKTDMRGRQRRLQKVCTRWHDERKKLLQSEQRMARRRICNRLKSNDPNQTTTFPKECDDLVLQIQEQQAIYPDADCEAFAKGPDGLEVPSCEPAAANSGALSVTAAYGTTIMTTLVVASLLASFFVTIA